MKGNYTKIILIIALILVAAIYYQFSTDITDKDYMEAKAGFMDLSAKDLDKGIVDLDGEWEFYPEIYTVNNFSQKHYIKVPDRWNNYNYNGNSLNAYSYGTYHLKLKLPREGLYCFNIRFISSAYKLFVNQTEIAENGKIQTLKTEETATWEPRIIACYSKTKDMDIVIRYLILTITKEVLSTVFYLGTIPMFILIICKIL